MSERTAETGPPFDLVTITECPHWMAAAGELISEFLLLPDSWVLGVDGFDGSLPEFLADEIRNLPGVAVPPEGEIVVAIAGGDAIGTAQIRRMDAVTCELKRMYVRDGFRRWGVGRKLVDAARNQAVSMNYLNMYLDVTPNRPGSIRFYESLGFVRCAARHDYGDSGIISLIGPVDSRPR